jgi:LPS-assembly lipoprotein
MWSREHNAALSRLLRLAAVMALAGAVGGCFQPLYAERSPTGGPGVREMMAAVEIPPISAPTGTSLARIAVETQNELRFGLTSGGGTGAPTHRLTIRLAQGNSAIIVDRSTGRAEFSNYNLTASYALIEIATSKQVMSAESTTPVTYDIPGQEQRFAAARGLKDAESRAAKVIVDQIKTRLASYFAAGT